MLKEAVLLGLMSMMVVWAAEDVTTSTTASSTIDANSTFVTIGSNQPSSSVNETVPIVHAISAQARKIEMTKLNSAIGGDVTASLKTPSGSNGSLAIGTTGIAIIVAVVAILIVTVLVGTAIFVMRRRFSVWRLNGSKQNLNAGGAGDGGESGGTSGTGSVADEKVVVVVTPSSTSAATTSPDDDENVAATPSEQQLTSVENKNAVVNVVALDDANTHVAAPVAQSEPQQQAVSETAAADDANKELATTNEGSKQEQEQQQQQVQDVSSQSLIVNVLNELSDSVAKKVDEAIKTEQVANDTDKQPLNE